MMRYSYGLMLMLGALCIWNAGIANAQLPQSDGVCPLPFDFEVDYADTTYGDVPTACPLDPSELDCFECGCAIASVTIGAAIAGGFVTEEYLLEPNSTAV